MCSCRALMLLLFLLFPSSLVAVDEGFAQVKRTALRNHDALPILKDLTSRYANRLTGSNGARAACGWAAQTMRTAGLTHVHVETWRFAAGWRRGRAHATLLKPQVRELTVSSFGWTGGTPRAVEAPVIAVRGLNGKARNDWSGAILLIEPEFPQGDLGRLVEAAQSAHAAAVIHHNPRPGAALLHTDPVFFPVRQTQIPVLDLPQDEMQVLLGLARTGARTVLRLAVDNRFLPSLDSCNVSGEIEGSAFPDQIVLLGAHLDAWDLATGAIDDGFGVAAILGAARSIVKSGMRPARTLRFVLFTGEEQGLLGSRAYVRAHAAEMPKIACAIVLDWGQGSIKKFPLAGHEELAESLRPLLAQIRDIADIEISHGYLTYTDAYAFTFAGVPAFAPWQDSDRYAEFAHSSGDRIHLVDPQILHQDSAIVALAAFWLASGRESPGRFLDAKSTAAMLEGQRENLTKLGLWPF